jgi:hypothetical protein
MMIETVHIFGLIQFWGFSGVFLGIPAIRSIESPVFGDVNHGKT